MEGQTVIRKKQAAKTNNAGPAFNVSHSPVVSGKELFQAKDVNKRNRLENRQKICRVFCLMSLLVLPVKSRMTISTRSNNPNVRIPVSTLDEIQAKYPNAPSINNPDHSQLEAFNPILADEVINALLTTARIVNSMGQMIISI
jgi:hypothetical protein